MKKIAIIGAGISGLFIANLFKKNPNYQITIYEKNNSINLEEGYGIQLSVNSVKLLNEIGFDSIENKNKFTPEKIDLKNYKIMKNSILKKLIFIQMIIQKKYVNLISQILTLKIVSILL